MERAKAALERYWASRGSPARVTQAMAEEVQHPLFVVGRTSAEIEADFETVGNPSLTDLVQMLERLVPKEALVRKHPSLVPGEIPGASSWKIS
ncbi:MAG: hypothetical protein ABIG34_02420 [Candidatus Peregrinibacteria bacterium]